MNKQHAPATVISKFFKDKDGHIAMWQFPNIPLIGWLVFMIVAMLVNYGRWHNDAEFLSAALLYTWAYLEIRSGVSWFRRVLGGVVLIYIVVSHFK